MLKNLFKTTTIVLVVLFTLLICESGYRIYRWTQLSKGDFSFLWVEKPIYQYDAESGFRYVPNQKLTAHWVAPDDSIQRNNQLSFNNQGQRAPEPSTYAKMPGEYRIAIIGDSISACIHNDVPWSASLQKRLNRDEGLKTHLKASFFKVLNFSRDGIGLVQYPAILATEVQNFHPDLILVNFITDDLYRRFIWRKTLSLPGSTLPYKALLNCTTLPAEFKNPNCFFAGVINLDRAHFENPALRAAIRKEIATQIEARTQWLSPYPEFLNTLSKGRLESLVGRPAFLPKAPTYENRELFLKDSASALKKLKASATPLLLLHIPVYWEMIYNRVPNIIEVLSSRVPEVELISMLDYLPEPYERTDVNRWTHFPLDQHFTNEGVEIYAQAVHKLLRKKQKLSTDLMATR